MPGWFFQFSSPERSGERAPARLSLRWSLLIILSSVVIVTGSVSLTFLLWPAAPTSPIKVLFHASFSQEKLPGSYLVAMLDLSKHPHDFVRFDGRSAEKMLNAHPIFKEARIRKVRPDALCINYSLRHPVILLGNRHNTAVDDEGVLIPVAPFFKNAPKMVLYVSEESLKGDWGTSLASKAIDSIGMILNAWKQEAPSGVILKCVDISRISHPSAGRRQIILTVGEGESEIYLQLTQESFMEQLAYYFAMRPYLENPFVVDLRNPSLALVSNHLKLN